MARGAVSHCLTLNPENRASPQKTQPAEADQEGFEVPGGKGYKYFGRARELPGVKDLLEQNACTHLETIVWIIDETQKNIAVIAPPKTRAELQKNVDADYYGFRDDEDGLLFSLEASAEEKGALLFFFFFFLVLI